MPIDTISDYSVWLTIATFIPLRRGAGDPLRAE